MVAAKSCVRFASPGGLGAEGFNEDVFCPNCGSKNDDSAARCAQCGFEIQAVKASPRFKGTMVMQAPVLPATPGRPVPQPGARPAAGPITGGQAATGSGQATGAPVARPSALKGTMVGVAPPEMEDLRRQIAESRAAQGGAHPAPPNPAPPSPVQPGQSARLKGTMIGLAPPGMDAAVQPSHSPLPSAPVEPNVGKPSAMPSQLKGTMVGAAPIDPATLAAALDRTPGPMAAHGARASAEAFGGTMLASSQPSFGATQPMDQLGSTQPFERPFENSTDASGWAPAAPQRSEFTHNSTVPAPAARPLATTPPAKSNLPVIVLIVLVVVLALALVGFGIALRSRNEEPAVTPGAASESPAVAK